jgi:regulatory protein
MAEDDRAEIESAAMRFLARRDYSTGELRGKLLRKEFEADAVDAVIAGFVERGWIDDRRFAEQQAEILHRKEWGPFQVVRKLTSHGVPDDLAQEVVDELGRERGWSQTCRARLLSRFGAPGELEQDDKASAYRHLTYRGFPPNLVRAVLFDGASE